MKQLAESGIRKLQKPPVSTHLTRRSMITREDNPPSINQPNIEDILDLELSDTLINAAYNLAVTKITLAIHKMCTPVESTFKRVKFFGFQNIKIYANRVSIVGEENEKKKMFQAGMESRNSILFQIEMLKEESVIKMKGNQQILISRELRRQKVKFDLKKKLQKICKIMSKKITKNLYASFLTLLTHSSQPSVQKPVIKSSIQQTFEKYQQTKNNQRHFHRRSIDKQPQRKSSNQLTYSLNKPYEYQSSRIKSPERVLNSKNLLYNHNTDKKASTCSQTQSNNSQKESESLSRDFYYNQTVKPSQSTSTLNKLKVTPSSKHLLSPRATKAQESKISSVLTNGSYFAEGTKERELEILRHKYFRLVQEFKDFSERFLQVIKEE